MNKVIIIFLFFLISCEEKQPIKTIEKHKLEQREALKYTLDNSKITGTIKKINNYQYSVNLISAYDYIRIKHESIEPGDISELKQEKILLLEIDDLKNRKILDEKKIRISKDEMTKYLIGSITNDISLVTKNKNIYPLNVNFETAHGAENKLKFVFFFDSKINSKIDHVEFYDRFFGSGLIRLKIK